MRVSLLLPLSLLCLLSLCVSVAAAARHPRPHVGVGQDRLRGAGGAHSPLAPPLLDLSDAAAVVTRLSTPGFVSAPDPRYKDNVADGWITRGAVVAFNESVSAQLKEDTLNSLLYAQLVCRGRVGFVNLGDMVSCLSGNLTTPLRWIFNVLSSTSPVARDEKQPLAEDVLSIPEGRTQSTPFPADFRRLARAAVESLRVEDDAYAAFHNVSTNGTRNAFLVTVASVVNGDLRVWTATYQVVTTAQSYQVLWATYPRAAARLESILTASSPHGALWNDEFRQNLRATLANFLPGDIRSKPIKW